MAGEPLESIAPASLAAGLRYQPAGGSWGFELSGVSTEAKAESDLPAGSTQFRPPSSAVFDLAAWYRWNEHLSLQLSLWNLTDETHWPWTYARGRSEGSPTLDRFTAPGRGLGLQLRFTL